MREITTISSPDIVANPFQQAKLAEHRSVDLLGEIQSVQVLAAVQGVAIQREEKVVESNAMLADSLIESLAEVVNEMRIGYANVGREANYWLFGFQSSQLMVVVRGECAIWALLKRDTDQLELVHTKLKSILRTCYDTISGAPSIGVGARAPLATVNDSWPVFIELVRSLLCRVIGGAQADRIIQRELTARNFTTEQAAPAAEYRAIGQAVLEKVPNKSRRKTLLSEFDAAVDKI